MIYDAKTWDFPYLYNLIDQYRDLHKYNNGYAYNMMFVGPGWMNKMGRWEAPYELLLKSYTDGCRYYGDLKKQGKLIDMTMSEFAAWYRNKKSYTEPECALWRDILYGSDKQLFWYCDPYMRAGINMDQGGALFDLRPYAAKLEWPVGIGTKHVQDCSYPFLIQEKYRAGYFTHYAGEGTIRSAKVRFKGEEADFCQFRTKAHFSEERVENEGKSTAGSKRILTLDPCEFVLCGKKFTLQTKITFEEGSGCIRYDRAFLSADDPDAEIEIDEYMVACYGTTEYPEDMTCITLALGRKDDPNAEVVRYEYKDRKIVKSGAAATAEIPAIETRVSMYADGAEGYIREGHAFSPMFTLGQKKSIKAGEVFTTWLSLEKAD